MADIEKNETDGEAAKTAKAPTISKADRELALRQREIQLAKAELVATKATNIFDPIAYTQLKNLASDLIAGGATSRDVKTAEQMLVKLQAGFELGMTPVQSLNSLYIVNGKTTIYGAALIARLRLRGWRVRYLNESVDSTTIEVTRDDEVIEDTFYYQDAVDSGYTSGDGGEKIGWKKGQNRKLKMRYGAAAQLVKTFLPEVLNDQNIGVTEIDGDVIEGEVVGEEMTRRERLEAADAERAALSDEQFEAKAMK